MGRKLNQELLPLIPKDVPIPSDYESEEDFTKAFDKWESDCTTILEENRKRFEKALKVSNQCSFFKALVFMPMDYHFKWCPALHWYNMSLDNE